MNKKQIAVGLDLDAIVSVAAGDATHKVGIAFDDDGQPTVGFVVVGRDSDQYRSAMAKERAAGIRRQAHKGQRIDAKTEEGARKIGQMLEKSQLEITLAVTVDWFGLTSGGAPAAFSREKLAELLKARPSFQEKILEALEVEDNFLPK